MKIAFCFLTYDEIVRYDIWNEFFKNINKEYYSVFIHPKNIINFNNYTFPYNIVKNRVKTTRKEDISIVKATIKLLEDAYETDKSITHYIFLTQSCIPLYNFNILFKVIEKIPLSLISFIDNNKKERYNQLSTQLKKFIHPVQFVKQQPNMILIKDDVELIIKNDLTEHFKYMECPDEHYFINIIPNILKRKFIKKQIHFCNTDFHKTQAIEFQLVNKSFLDQVRKYGFLFLRKVSKKTIIDIHHLFF